MLSLGRNGVIAMTKPNVATPQNAERKMVINVEALLNSRLPLSRAVRDFEWALINAAIRRANGEITAAAQILGVHPNTIFNKRRRQVRG